MGDMNYRLNTSFTELKNVKDEAINMIKTHDQLTIARNEGNYPLYQEAEINFLPSYKMSKDSLVYINKKN